MSEWLTHQIFINPPGTCRDRGVKPSTLEITGITLRRLFKRCICSVHTQRQWKITVLFHCGMSARACVVCRSLQIHKETGVPHSCWLAEQRGQEGGDGLGGPLRYPDPCIFWLHADMDGEQEGWCGFSFHCDLLFTKARETDLLK